jgi:hypothetical protein
MAKQDKPFYCKHCNKAFSHSSSMYRHIKQAHSKPIDTPNLFGKPDIDYILNDNAFLLDCFFNLKGNGLPDLIESMILNPLYPCNHNVKHKRDHYPPLLCVFTETGWIDRHADGIIDTLILSCLNLLREHPEIKSHIALPSTYFEEKPISPQESQFRIELCSTTQYIYAKKRGYYRHIRDEVFARIKKHKTLTPVS